MPLAMRRSGEPPGSWRAPRALHLALVAAAALGGVIAFTVRISGAMPDFDVYWQAGVRAAAGEPLYQPEDRHYQLKYLPAFAVLAVPLGALPRDVAAALWFAASLAALAALLYASVRLLPDRRRPVTLLVAAALVVCGKFYARELLLGQVNLLFALAVVAAILLLGRGHGAGAGTLVGLAVVLKPYAVLLLPWLALTPRARAAWSAGAALLVALLLPVVLYGAAGTIALHRAWLDVVLGTTGPNLLNPDNVSWLAMYSRWIGPGAGAGALTLATGAAALGLFAWACARRWRVGYPERLEGALLLTLMPFLSPQGWDYVLLIATPAVMFVVNYDAALPAAWRWTARAALVVVGLTLYDVMGREPYHAFMNASGITLCFFVLAATLLRLRAQGTA